jgi:menaquinol-cytochrome c reductase iron-sulfur subunit
MTVAKHPSSTDEQIQTTRRGFLQLVTGALGLLTGVGLGIPLVGALIGPALRKAKSHWSKVTRVESLTTRKPTDLTFPDQTEDAFIRETALRSAWAIKHSSSEVTVFSPICPHLGCGYNWDPQTEHFECPCHGSVFDRDGKVLAGPAPRPLDTLPAKIEDGELWVEWKRFKLGIPEKSAA